MRFGDKTRPVHHPVLKPANLPDFLAGAHLGQSSVRKLPTPSGPFAFQLYFEDLGEIDDICLEALKRQSLLPSKPAPIRIERFVEKEFKTALRYEDLGPDNLAAGFSIRRVPWRR